VKTPFLPIRVRKGIFFKECFYAWLEAGTCAKAQRLLAKKNILNPMTGKPYTYMAVYLGAYTYLVENYDLLKPVLFELWGLSEEDMTQKEWEVYIVQKAVMALGNSSKKRFMKWIERNPWAKEYDYVYAKRFGLRQESSSGV